MFQKLQCRMKRHVLSLEDEGKLEKEKSITTKCGSCQKNVTAKVDSGNPEYYEVLEIES